MVFFFGYATVADARMRAAAEALIESVEPAKRAELVLSFEHAARTNWHYRPRSRPGLTFGDFDGKQRELVHRLLKTALSELGHRKVVNIIELELVLRELELFSRLRNPENYAVVIFGTPDAGKPWGWRFEGHHLSLNFTLSGERIAASPSFFGANPAEVKKGPRTGLRALAPEQDEAFALLNMLNGEQKRAAIIDNRTYGDIVTGAMAQVSPLENRGIEARDLTEPQRAQLRKLIEVYADTFEPSLRKARLARVAEAPFDSIRFAWVGAADRTDRHYYRVQGTTFLIEFDASQSNGNHIHTVWRDFDGDFGRDLLREHHQATRGTTHRH